MAPSHFFAVLSVVVPFSAGSFSCLNEHGHSVDWFAALKGNDGTDVHYHDASSSGGHLDAATALDSEHSAIVATVKQLYTHLGKSYAYALYNDETDDGKKSSTHAHSKGVILFDDSQGFWLVHSLPRWPGNVKHGYGGLPDTTYGQSYLCLSFKLSELEAIAKIQLMQWPQLYSSGISKDLERELPNFKAWIDGGKSHEVRATTKLQTLGGRTFTSYGKSAACNCNLYSDIVATGLGSDLWVESWQHGSQSIKMPDFCKKDGYKHNIYNIRTLKLRGDRGWTELQDHSKWAVTAESQHTVCIGDINRQTSQAKRGGGTICYKDVDLWHAFHEIVDTYDKCDKVSHNVPHLTSNASVVIV